MSIGNYFVNVGNSLNSGPRNECNQGRIAWGRFKVDYFLMSAAARGLKNLLFLALTHHHSSDIKVIYLFF